MGALEAFVNLGDTLDEFLAFGSQNPDFFPVQILDEATMSLTPLAPPCVQGTANMVESIYLVLSGQLEAAREIAGTDKDSFHGEERIWTKVVAWEPACKKLAVFYRDVLRLAWERPKTGPHSVEACEEFLILLGIDAPVGYGDWQEAFQVIRDIYPAAEATGVHFSQLWPDWRTGTFEYLPQDDFQRAVYILFREGWRAKTCPHCTRRFIAGKARQVYCSTKCAGEIKRERGNQWWSAHGKRWRAKRPAKGGRSEDIKSGRPRKRIRKYTGESTEVNRGKS